MIQTEINGEARAVDGQPDRSLLHVLRDELGLTEAKPGCGEGACGACTVLVDGDPVRSCTIPVGAVAGRRVTTLRGLQGDAAQRALADAFVAEDAMQCGYCTPGMLVAAAALLRRQSGPVPRIEIVAALDGNVCRCGAYSRIVRAVERASEEIARDRPVETTDQESSRNVDAASDSTAGSTASLVAGRSPARPWDLTQPEDRDWFDRLGDGLVVVLSPDEADRIDNGSGGAWSTEGGGWLHVGADGRVTAFTGKVDVGQGNRAALSSLVADGIGAQVASVSLVMGDTDVCPYDIGTFGSRSMADAGSVLTATARGARRVLIDAAARRWEVEPEEIEIADGRAITRDRGRSAALAELFAGERRLEFASAKDLSERPPVSARVGTRAGGGPPLRSLYGTPSMVAGTIRYSSDLSLPGVLHGRILRPPSVGATLRSADLSQAEAMPGVIAIHEGDIVGVAAPDATLAERALAAIASSAEWDEHPQPAEADLEAWLRDHPVDESGWEGAFHHESGDVDWALASAPITLSATYRAAYIAHVPLETRAAVAEWDADKRGGVTVWTGTQRPFGVREELAEALDLGQEDVRVVVPPTGSAYGGKHTGEVAVEAARLARAAGRPVKVRWSRAEEFAEGYLRPAAVIDVRAGLEPRGVGDIAGTVTAWEFRNINSGPMAILTPYEVPNQRIDYQPADSPLRQGSYRGLAATANTFARESAMDELAHALAVDPLAFRLRHLPDDRLAAVFRAAAEGASWPGVPGRPGDRSGLGIAGGIEKDARVATCIQVRVEGSGELHVERIVTAFDCGAIVDRENLQNQVEGATVMALGGALFEEIHFTERRIVNGSMTEYRVPRFSDVPPIEVILIDRRDRPPAGAGETPMIAVAPAIANAIFAATGRRLRSMPLVPDGRIPD